MGKNFNRVFFGVFLLVLFAIMAVKFFYKREPESPIPTSSNFPSYKDKPLINKGDSQVLNNKIAKVKLPTNEEIKNKRTLLSFKGKEYISTGIRDGENLKIKEKTTGKTAILTPYFFVKSSQLETVEPILKKKNLEIIKKFSHLKRIYIKAHDVALVLEESNDLKNELAKKNIQVTTELEIFTRVPKTKSFSI